jgi:hypothetical protein
LGEGWGEDIISPIIVRNLLSFCHVSSILGLNGGSFWQTLEGLRLKSPSWSRVFRVISENATFQRQIFHLGLKAEAVSTAKIPFDYPRGYEYFGGRCFPCSEVNHTIPFLRKAKDQRNEDALANFGGL